MKFLFCLLLCAMFTNFAQGQAFCLKTITNYPYTESFETQSIPNDWINGTPSGTSGPADNLSWIRQVGATPTSGTGPSGAQNGSYYLYTSAASNPNYNDYSGAILYSPCFNLANAVRPAITFSYHMNGANSDGLYLQASINGSAWTTVWERYGNRRDSWRNVYVDLSHYNPTGFYIGNPPVLQLRFVSSVHDGPLGDVAIDNIRIYGQSSFSFCTYQSINYGFEDYISGWTQSTTDDIDWKEESVYSPYNTTGPISTPDASLDYLHIVSDGSVNKQAVLTSKCISLNNIFSPKIAFSYHLRNASNSGLPGNLLLEISTNNGATWTNLWSRSWHTNNSWERATVSLGSYSDKTVLLRFTGTVYAFPGSPAIHRISLDDVSIFSAIFFGKDKEENSPVMTQLEEAPSLSVFPNPFQDQFSFQTTLSQAEGFRLTNLQGITVLQGDIQQSQISVHDLPKGVYFMTVYNAEQQLTQKIIKQ